MDRENTLLKFYNTDVLDACYDTLLKADQELKKHKKEISARILSMLDYFFLQVADLQHKGQKADIYCVGFQLLRSKLLYRECDVLVSAYDKDFYNDKGAVHLHFDMHDVFGYLFDIEDTLKKETNRYFGKISRDDVSMAVQRLVEVYKSYMVQLVRLGVKDIHTLDGFNRLKKQDSFIIIAGEYKDNLEFVYQTPAQKSEREIKKIIKEIDGNPKGNFFYLSYTDLPLMKLDLRNENFCYTDFSRANVSLCDCRVGFYIGSNFTDAIAAGVNFENSYMHDAIFKNCDLFGSDFSRTNSNLTIPTKDVLFSPGFCGVDFRGAKLNHVNFTEGNFIGADFRGAVFEDTIFDGANLKDAVFLKEDLSKFALSEQQRNVIIAV